LGILNSGTEKRLGLPLALEFGVEIGPEYSRKLAMPDLVMMLRDRPDRGAVLFGALTKITP
jgi:hypothetical protein